MEKVFNGQIINYVNQCNILFNFQSGFRHNYSTETCLIFLTDYIKKKIDQGKYCGMAMLDLQKAFDTVNHKILAYKLKAMGFSKEALGLIMSYLTGRTQIVSVQAIRT